jgi:Ca-activated chloride channel family protein
MFELALPWVFILLPLPLCSWFLLKRVHLQLSTALKVPFFRAMVGLVEHEKRAFNKQLHIGLWLLVWSLLLLALSGPHWVGQPIPLSREGYNIMLAMDISPSMDVSDMQLNGHPATRLQVVKQAAEQFVQDRAGDKIGLILFGERAYLLTPLTYDRHSVMMRLDDATVGLAGNTTSLGDALGLAIKRLQNVPANGRMIILLTDGANNSGVLAPLKAAELARADGIKVYTIGLNSQLDPHTFGGMFLNMNGAADLDEHTLKAIAKMTGGRYFRATDMHSLQSIYRIINRMTTVKQEQATVRPQHEYYAWPLTLAFLLFMYLIMQESGLFIQLKSGVYE